MTRDLFTRPKWSYPNTQGTQILEHRSDSEYDAAWREVADKVQTEYGDRVSHIVKLTVSGDDSDTATYAYRIILKIPAV